jgi:hypothetical protein
MLVSIERLMLQGSGANFILKKREKKKRGKEGKNDMRRKEKRKREKEVSEFSKLLSLTRTLMRSGVGFDFIGRLMSYRLRQSTKYFGHSAEKGASTGTEQVLVRPI